MLRHHTLWLLAGRRRSEPKGALVLRIAKSREEIYNCFHQSAGCAKFFFDPAQGERYAAYYTSMYILQDTTESLMAHRAKGFSSDPLVAYIEFWGVMQALFIQQDSISELHVAVTGGRLQTDKLTSWQSLRTVRNICAGHPAKKDRPTASPICRTFMGRQFGGYSGFTYEQWQSGGGISNRTVQLGALIDGYADEAQVQLAAVLQSMKQQWP
jgi:hypothetical protein